MADYPHTFQALKTGGAFYVLWIAWRILKSGALAGSQTAKSTSFLDGVLLLVLNPKAYIIIMLMFTQFLPKIDSEAAFAVLLITSIFTLNNFLAFVVWRQLAIKLPADFEQKRVHKD
ncbi:MAG: lysine exporter protein LysE/YggA [Osedax symbiont Rs1]|nr:MAG: lysine exporter protein LysE/YggA [Osedax symbiont Rs1]